MTSQPRDRTAQLHPEHIGKQEFDLFTAPEQCNGDHEIPYGISKDYTPVDSTQYVRLTRLTRANTTNMSSLLHCSDGFIYAYTLIYAHIRADVTWAWWPHTSSKPMQPINPSPASSKPIKWFPRLNLLKYPSILTTRPTYDISPNPLSRVPSGPRLSI